MKRKAVVSFVLVVLFLVSMFSTRTINDVSATLTPSTVNATLSPGQSISEHKTVFLSVPIPKGDVIFAFDCTGSMSGAIDVAKAQAVSIMTTLGTLIADVQFGVMSFMDYPHSYSSYGYSNTYGDASYGDYAYRLDQPVTSNTSLVSNKINALVIGSGADAPQDYARIIFESYSDTGIGWRAGARHVLVLLGDSVPHYENLNEGISGNSSLPNWPGNYTTGGDPGTDEVMFTLDDIYLPTALQAMATNQITLLYVKCHGGAFPDDTSNMMYWNYWTSITGGAAYGISDASRVPDAIGALVSGAATHINKLTLNAQTGYETWLTSVVPPEYDNITIPPAGVNETFDIVITVPLGTVPGSYVFDITANADGASYGEQQVTILVPGQHDVAVTDVNPSQTIVSQGDSLDVNVTARNLGDNPETFNVTAYANPTATSSGLIGYWKFDEGNGTIVQDSSRNGNNGTISGATWTNGKIGSALEFDGASYVDCGNSASLNVIGNITVSTWVRFNALPGDMVAFISKDEGGGYKYKWEFGYAQNYAGISNALMFHINTPAGANVWLRSLTFTPVIGQWYHVAIVKSNNNYTFYLDGENRGEDTSTCALPSVNAPVEIGRAEGSFYFNGTMDEARIYNETLSADEIMVLAFTGDINVNETGLMGYWEFGEGSGTTAYDSSGNNNQGTLINGPTWVDGKFGEALSFDGVDNYVEIPDSASLDITNQITISGWFNLRGTVVSGGKGAGHSLAEKWNVYGVRIDSSGFYGYVSIGGNATACELKAPGTPSTYTWYHVAYTFDGFQAKIYVNGDLAASRSCSGSIDTSNLPLLIGANGGGGQFNGTIDDIRIYNRALSAEEIRALVGFSQTQTVTNLQPHTSTTLTFAWNTTGFACGDYLLSAYAWPVPGETDVADNTFVDGVVQIVQAAGGGGGVFGVGGQTVPYAD